MSVNDNVTLKKKLKLLSIHFCKGTSSMVNINANFVLTFERRHLMLGMFTAG